MEDFFYTIENNVKGEIKVLKSKFIAQAFPIKKTNQIADILQLVRKEYFDASHHPYAYRVKEKNTFKISDDGEPSGTSGKPILEAIDKFNLNNILVVVTRYFGGTKLGTGGLRRAYFDAAVSLLEKSNIIEIHLTSQINLKFDYKYMNSIMKIFEKEKIKILENNSSEEINLVCDVRLSKISKLQEELKNLTNGTIVINEKHSD